MAIKKGDTLTFNVTKKNLENGQPSFADACAIALSIKAKGYTEVKVVGPSVSFKSKTGKTVYYGNVDAKSSRKITTYDKYDTGVEASKHMKPFTVQFKVRHIGKSFNFGG